jgi:ABC-type multidrug transport system permease subunit
MFTLLHLIGKNLKLLIRSKSSALIIILGPLLVIFLLGITFDNINKYSLNLGVYSASYSELSESFIAKLKEKEYRVQKYDSEQNCIDQIKKGKLHACIIFPPGLTIEPGKMNEIVFHVDYSKINLIWMVLDTLSTKLKERSSELSMDLTSALLKKIDDTKNEIYQAKPIAVNIKTENQQSAEKIETFNAKVVSSKDTSIQTKAYFQQKIEGAQKTVAEVKTLISNVNVSKGQKDYINTKVADIGTYLLNMYNKIADPSNKEADWIKINRLMTEAVSEIASLKSLVAASGTKITDIQSTLDRIYTSLDSIEIKEAATIISPVTTSIKPVVPEKTYLNYAFPSLIILVVMFISILLSTTLVQMERHSPAYFRNFITPTHTITFILGTYFTNMLLVAMQLVIILSISAKFFSMQIISNLGLIIPALLIITTFFTVVGILIGYLFMSEETATLASISTGSIFLFLSNVIMPLESMPDYIRNIAQYNPFVLSENILRKVIIFQEKFASIKQEMIYLSIAAFVIFAIVWTIHTLKRRHLFHRFSFKIHRH